MGGTWSNSPPQNSSCLHSHRSLSSSGEDFAEELVQTFDLREAKYSTCLPIDFKGFGNKGQYHSPRFIDGKNKAAEEGNYFLDIMRQFRTEY